MPRSSNFRSSVGIGKRSRYGVQRQSVQELFQGILSGQQGAAAGGEAAFAQLDAHGPPFSAYFPAPAPIIFCRENDYIERSAWRRREHDQSNSYRSSIRRTRRSGIPEVDSRKESIAAIAKSRVRSTPPDWFPGAPASDIRHPIRSRAGEGHWDRFRFSAGACEPGFSGTGCYRAGCHSISP